MINYQHIYSYLNKDINWIQSNTILLVKYGSHAYGLNTESSDEDYRGITIPPKQYYLGFHKKFNEWIVNEPFDITIFNIVKYFSLAKDGNPNCLELLFVDESDVVHVDDLGKLLLANRDKFLSRALKERYIGYAKAQAHRIKQHKRWLDNPIYQVPTRKEFGLADKLEIPKDQMMVVQALIKKQLDQWTCDFEPFSEPQKIYLQNKVSDILSEMSITSDNKWMCAARNLGVNENYIALIQKEKQYQNLVDDYQNYQTWKKNRNPKRAELEKKIGYDSKHACQLIRLLKLGKEILLTGKVQVKRTEDREELMNIKNGLVPYEDLINQADRIEQEVKDAYFSSPLPLHTDIVYLDKLCISMVETCLESPNYSK